MSRTLFGCHRLVAVLFLIVCFSTALGAADEVGTRIDNFELRDSLGAVHSLDALPAENLVVVAFLGNDCPLANLYAPRLQALSDKIENLSVIEGRTT